MVSKCVVTLLIFLFLFALLITAAFWISLFIALTGRAVRA